MYRRKTVSPGTVCRLMIFGVAFALRTTHGSTFTSSGSSYSATGVAFPNCTGEPSYIGDGECDDYYNNNVECGYDGGDCCRCTCVSTSSTVCGSANFNCMDPTAGDYTLGCKVVAIDPPAVSPCLVGTPRRWVVETTTDANLLADSILCSGGSFEVEWNGYVSVNMTLYVIHGTVLHVVGGSDAVADGGGATQLFAAFGGSLRVSGLRLSGGFGFYGGAISAVDDSNVTLTTVDFSSNAAEGHGGAIRLDASSLELNNSCTFTNNSATYGGAIYAGNSSTFKPYVGGGEIYRFTHNSATAGGALYISDDSEYTEYSHLSDGATSANTLFANNTAQTSGGSIVIVDNSRWDSDGEITLEGNTAEHGGAVFIADWSKVQWNGAIHFANNRARADGGAVVLSRGGYLGYLYVTAGAKFSNNTCGGSGGAISSSGGTSLYFGNDSALEFSGNSAALFGGAMYSAQETVGFNLANARFTENQAQSGGAVYAAGSGTDTTTSSGYVDEPRPFPTTFSNCTFVENAAQDAGGAIEIAIGRVYVENTVFSGNVASVGGALKLFCTAVLSNSSFYDNISGKDGGSAISGVGSTFEMTGLKFSANRFACATTEFLDFSEGNDSFATVCQGCDAPCQGCTVEDNTSVPTCTTLFPHAMGEGHTTTIDMVLVDPGYWRPSNESTNVLPCYNPDACLGGLTDDPDYCRVGYEGPYCSVCSEEYAATLAFTCTSCSDGNVAVVVVLLAIALLGTLTFARHLIVSTEHEDTTGRGFIVRVGKVLPLQSIKIVIVTWQIITQFSTVTYVLYPRIYQRLLDAVALVNFDIEWMLSAGCIMDTDFHDGLLVATITPIVVLALLGVTYAFATYRHQEAERALRAIGRKHLDAVVLLTFLVYSSVSSTVFSTFACDELDDGEKAYLRVDYRIECNSPRHKSFQIYAGFMIFVYPVGIPLFYAILLFREQMKVRTGLDEESPQYQSSSTLRRPYRPPVFYYEVVECTRRVMLTGVVVFIYPNTAAQIAVSTTIAFAFVLISEGLRPYASRWDAWVSRVGHVLVVLSMYVALLLKVNVANETHHDQNIFAGILVAGHVIVILLVIVEIIAMMYSMRNQENSLPVAVSRGTSAASFAHGSNGSTSIPCVES